MKRTLFLSAVLLFAAAMVGQPRRSGPLPVESQRQLVDQYCAGCHNDNVKAGGFSWTEVDLEHPERSAERVEKIIRKVRVGMMPPAGSRRPDAAAVKAFLDGLETAIDRSSAAKPIARAPELHRLNRTEYHNSIRDLLELDVDVSTLLPPDSAVDGFDNIADVLTVTPALMQGYIRAAGKISRAAVGQTESIPSVSSYSVPKTVNQAGRVEGTPLGTRGGIAVVHNFPADGEYTFKVTNQGFGRLLPPPLRNQQIDVSVDGERVALFTLDPSHREDYVAPPIRIKAGPRRVAAAFVSRFEGPMEDRVRQYEGDSFGDAVGVTALPNLETLVVAGPMNVTGISETPTRRRIFLCRSANASEELPCATRIVTNLAGHAFRKRVTAEDLESLMDLYNMGRASKDFENGIRLALQAILADPQFIFRFERNATGLDPDKNYPISDVELASRLSFFLWSSVPDDQLINKAREGKLKDPATLDQQVKRMLADSRSEALVNNFGGQWLRLRSLSEMLPDKSIFPDFTKNRADSMQRETLLLLDDIIQQDRDVLELVTANYTFVDELLARHYRIPNIAGAGFQKITLTDPNRFGILGHASILTLTSLSNRTSPVARGKYVLEVLLGVSPPKPPAVAPPLKENALDEKPQSVRQRIEQHRANPACASCHKLMDPIGLTLENFDAVGAWRMKDGGIAIDASARLYDGANLDGPASLRQAIVSHSGSFYENLAEKLLAYGLGRVLDYRDMPVVRSIRREAAMNNNRFSSFVLAVVKSAPFRMRKTDDVAPTAAKALK